MQKKNGKQHRSKDEDRETDNTTVEIAINKILENAINCVTKSIQKVKDDCVKEGTSVNPDKLRHMYGENLNTFHHAKIEIQQAWLTLLAKPNGVIKELGILYRFQSAYKELAELGELGRRKDVAFDEYQRLDRLLKEAYERRGLQNTDGD